MPVFTSPPIPTFAMTELWGSQVKRLVIEEELQWKEISSAPNAFSLILISGKLNSIGAFDLEVLVPQHIPDLLPHFVSNSEHIPSEQL